MVSFPRGDVHAECTHVQEPVALLRLSAVTTTIAQTASVLPSLRGKAFREPSGMGICARADLLRCGCDILVAGRLVCRCSTVESIWSAQYRVILIDALLGSLRG